MIFIYDITRLYARRNEITPTGIDRVDINYALFVLNSKHDVIFVRGERGALNTFPQSQAKAIIAKLAKCWTSQAIPKDASCLVDKKRPIKEVVSPSEEYIYINVSHQVVCGREGLIDLAEKKNVKLIYFCHDLIPIDYPEYVGDLGLEKHSALINLMLWTGDLIVLNSEYSKKSLVAYSEKKGYKLPNLKVIHLGNEKTLFQDKWQKDSPHSHFIYVSTFEPRKNHILLFLVWKKLYSILGENTPKLLLVGKKGWQIDWLERYFLVEPNIRRFVFRKEKITDDELKKLMLASYASLNPSYVEGWGLPAVECIGMGIPTACSDIDAYHEATQGLATYISPLDGNAWLDYVLRVLHGEISSPKNEQFIFETWEEHFDKFHQCLDDLSIIPNKNALSLYKKNLSSFDFSTPPNQETQSKPKQIPKIKYSAKKEKLLKSNSRIIRVLTRLFYNGTL